MEVLHKAHITTKDRTVLHKGLVSARTRTRRAPGPALPAASQRSCSLLHQASCYPCCHFKTSPTTSPAGTVAMWATTSLPHHTPRAGAAPGLCVKALHSWGSTGGLIPSIFVCKHRVSSLMHSPLTGDHHHLLTHTSPRRLQPSSLCGCAEAG